MQDNSSGDEVRNLREKISYLEESLYKKDSTNDRVVEEKEKRILDLEEENYSLNNRLNEKLQHLRNTEREMSSFKMSRMNESQRN